MLSTCNNRKETSAAGTACLEPNSRCVGPAEVQAFFRTFDQNVYRVMAGGRAAPTEAVMKVFEQSLDFRLPEEFREFTMSPLGGLLIEVHEDLWPRPPLAPAEPSWRAEYGLKIFGLSCPIPEWLDLREEIMKLPESEGDLIPFMARMGSQERFCYDLDGNILRWSPAGGARQILDLSFSELVLEELRALAERRAQLSAPAKKPAKAKRRKSAE